MSISSVILTKNEEKNIGDCLRSLSFCDEVLVIDDGSWDKTVSVAEKYGGKVFQRALNGDFSTQRNFGIDKARGEWILFVDADERISKNLGSEIIETVSKETNFSGFYIVRRDVLWGREMRYGEVGNIKLLRLAKRDSGKWRGKVHEEWRISGKIGSLVHPLIHYPHQTVEEFLKDINFYTDIRAKELNMQDIPVYWSSIIIYPVAKFAQNYFFKLGFLDGIPGLLIAILMSFHSFLVRSKLWQLQKK